MRIPPSVIADIVAANPGLAANPRVPDALTAAELGFMANDGLAFMSGYATRAGASRDIGPITLEYNPATLCSLDKGVSRIFDTNRTDLDAAMAWAAGYMQREVDEMPNLVKDCPKAIAPITTTRTQREKRVD